MTKQKLKELANQFRKAIEMARDAGEFKVENYRYEPMNKFPFDCCDDTVDLFIHFLFRNYKLISIKVTGSYYDTYRDRDCLHVWQETENWIIDMTGDQFINDCALPVKINGVYVGEEGDFHKQFKVKQRDHSCGIESLGDRSYSRMYELYDKIMKYMK